MSGPPNTSPGIGKPLILETDGVLGELPTGAVINAGGVSGSSFTVGGKHVVTTNSSNPNLAGVVGFEFLQNISSTTWNINHNGNTLRASVTIFDSSNMQIWPNTVHIVDNNNVTVTFSSAMTGRALVFLF